MKATPFEKWMLLLCVVQLLALMWAVREVQHLNDQLYGTVRQMAPPFSR